MRKGAFPIVAAIIIVILAAGIAINTGLMENLNLSFLRPAAILDDPTCIPGTVLQPKYIQLRCRADPIEFTGTFRVTILQTGIWPVINNFAEFYCPPPYVDYAEDTECKVVVSNTNQWIMDGYTYTSPGNFIMRPGESKRIDGLNLGASILMLYTKKQLFFDDIDSGIFDKKLCDGCDLTCTGMVTNAFYSSLPPEQQLMMEVGENIEYPLRWQAYEVVGGIVEYNGEITECVQMTASTATFYSLEQYRGLQSCYYFRSAVVGSEQCCPGAFTVGGVACNPTTYEWDTAAEGVCCPGGLCSVAYCPGGGAFAWAEWNPGLPIMTYTCNAATGDCVGTPVSYSVECNPNTNEGCPSTKDCEITSLSPLTTRCVDEATVQRSCVSMGLECCVAGEVPDYVTPRSCMEAGYPADYKCVNGFCTEPVPLNVCDYDGTCEAGESPQCPDCGEPNLFDWLIAFLKMWLIGAVLAAVAVVAAVIFIPPLRIVLIASPMLALIAIIVLGFLIALAFSAPVASLAATLL